MKKILVIGSEGLIGKELMALLGDKAIGIDKHAVGNNRISADIMDYSALEKIFVENKISSCINLAAVALPLECEKDKKEAFLINVIGNMNLVELCALHGADFYYASSARVYSANKLAKEDSLLNPKGAYMKTKLLSEKIIKSYYELGLLKNAVIFRFSNVYGKDEHRERLVPSLILKAKSGIIEITNAENTFDLVYVKDVVKAILLVVENSAGFEIFNIASGRLLSIKQVAKIIAKKKSALVKVKIISKGKPDYPKILIKKIESLGFKPSRFEDNIEDIINYY
jgi:nucleoside-diphosphate-sugar epimerase